MTGWFHVLLIQRSLLAETPAQLPLSIPCGLPVGRNEVEVVVSCRQLLREIYGSCAYRWHLSENWRMGRGLPGTHLLPPPQL